MKRIRYLSLITMLLCSIVTWGQDFNPTSPGEPGVAPRKLILKVHPVDGGSVYGSGRYVPETSVGLRVSSANGYIFERWTDEEGNTVSSAASFNFIKGDTDETLTAHFRFDPNAPSEPQEPSLIQYFNLTLAAEKGGSVSGGGKYIAGSKISISSSLDSGYKFVCWTNIAGDTVSSSRTFQYTTTAANETLTAHFVFNPSSPIEPSEPILKHKVIVSTKDGGTVSASASRLFEGEKCTITASANTGYRFLGWYVADTLYSSQSRLDYVMGKKDIHFVAVFEFNPYNPSDPQMPENNKYAFYMMTIIGKPGDELEIPYYLTSLDTLCDMSFQITFPENLKPDAQQILINEVASGYKVACTIVDDTCYQISMTGGKIPAGNIELLRFKVKIPEEYETGSSQRTKINQVSIVENNGTRTTASTRNGRIAVYKRGDTNGDNVVNVSDVMNMVSFVLKEKTEVFIKEVSDMNSDGEFNVTDAMGIANILLDE